MPTFQASARRTVILGGGVIGLSIAWRLAEAGAAVTVIERGQPGRATSWAAAGMLAAGIEAEPTEEPLFTLGRYSQSLWPDFAARVEAASGQPVGYDPTGTLVCAFSRDQAERLRRGVQFQRGLGGRFEWLGAAAARDREPGLSPNLVAAVFSPDDHTVDNRRLGPALAVAATAAGARILTEAEAHLLVEGHRVVGVTVGEETHLADHTVLAAGPWSAAVPGLPAAARPRVRPIKGQMLGLRMDPAAPLIRHVVWGDRCYLVPRADGRLILGATTEERGWDPRLTAGGVLGLLDDAWRTLPGIEDLALEETWVGFRPGSPDDMPILGASAVPGLILATGHHRNGILLTPATADLIARLILEGRPDPRLAPFAPDRFAS